MGEAFSGLPHAAPGSSEGLCKGSRHRSQSRQPQHGGEMWPTWMRVASCREGRLPSTLWMELCWLNPSRRSSTLRILFRRELDSMKALQGNLPRGHGGSPASRQEPQGRGPGPLTWTGADSAGGR